MHPRINRRAIRMAIVFLMLAVLLPTAATLPSRGDDGPGRDRAKRGNLAKNLIGTWTLAEAEEAGSPSGVGSRLKFFTGTHWMITQPDPETGEVVFHHGGHYALDGDTMTTTTDFANENAAEFIGKVRKFKIKVDADTYTQTGLDNPFNETWKRAK